MSAVAGSVVVEVRGELDATRVPELCEQLDGALALGGDVVVDCRALEFIDAAALGVLVGRLKRAMSSGNTLHLRDVRPQVANVLHLTRLTELFGVVPVAEQVARTA